MPFDHLIDQTELQPKKITKARFRRRIFAEWNHQCAYCTDPADTLDHVLPRSRGGLTVAENLIPACRRCNGAKSSTDWREWFRAQAWHCQEREGRIDGWLAGGLGRRDPPAGEHHSEHRDSSLP
jgi:5-methylcytosine-specific restriction endonuclease McrA